MKILAKTGNNEIAMVYIAQMPNGKCVEFVESVQPPIQREEKWVLILSSLYGCPVKCRFCDAGGEYKGKPTKEELLSQIDYLVQSRYPDKKIPAKKFKIQFARMGEPALNMAVLDVLEELPEIYKNKGLIPSISTIAPKGTDEFFKRLLDIKNRLYQGRFQMQFSIHTTDETLREWLIPVKKWSFAEIAEYGNRFYTKGDRKITLNFALAENMPVNPQILLEYFNPEKFLIKITPINPTSQAAKNNLSSYIQPENQDYGIVENLKKAGYDVILSIGELEENQIGSNCGQYLTNYNKEKEYKVNGYSYEVESV